MKVEQVKDLLSKKDFVLEGEREISHGHQLRFSNGAIVNVYSNGTVSPQGKDQDKVNKILGLSPGIDAAPSNQIQNNKVFVVYGHDKPARSNLEAMLRRWDLEPIILDRLPSEGQTVIEKLESYTADVNFAVVLATPDDIGHRVDHPDESSHRARQNVVLELGMLLSKLGRKRVAIILNQQENMERPSDIQGLIYIPYKDDLEKEAGLILAKEMVAQGYKIEVSHM